MIKTLDTVVPSATPTEADIAAWQDLPRDEQVRLLQEALAHPDCARHGAATMADLRARGQALAERLSSGSAAAPRKSWSRFMLTAN